MATPLSFVQTLELLKSHIIELSLEDATQIKNELVKYEGKEPGFDASELKQANDLLKSKGILKPEQNADERFVQWFKNE